MPAPVKLRLELTDVYGKPLREQLDVILRHLDLNEVSRQRVPGAARVDISGLRGAPLGRYRLDIDPPSFQYVSLFVNLKASGTTTVRLSFPVDPDKVVRVNFPRYTALASDLKRLLENSANVLGYVGKSGRELYEALDDHRRAGLLNLAAKCAATVYSNGRTVLSYVQNLNELRGDRFFAVVPKELREETKHGTDAGRFRAVSGSLHHPPPNFSSAGSFKTHDRYGNLQLTFFMRGDDCVADLDIDDAAGFEHVFQVLRNRFSGKPTHPYNIHQILVGFQQLDPGYRFEV